MDGVTHVVDGVTHVVDGVTHVVDSVTHVVGSVIDVVDSVIDVVDSVIDVVDIVFPPGYIPNCLEAVEAMLATASIGAVWSTTSPDFGVTVSSLLLSSFSAQYVYVFIVRFVFFCFAMLDH